MTVREASLALREAAYAYVEVPTASTQLALEKAAVEFAIFAITERSTRTAVDRT